MEQPGGLSVAACRSATASAAVRLLQTHRPHAVRLTVGPYHRRPVPGGVRGTTMELLVHSTRAQVPTRLDSRYTHGDSDGHRVINAWNSLSANIVTSPTVASFKYRIAKLKSMLHCCFYV